MCRTRAGADAARRGRSGRLAAPQTAGGDSGAAPAIASAERSWGLSPENEILLESWLPRLRAGEMAVLHAARSLGCSQRLVASARDGPRGVARRGRPPVLTKLEERAIEEQILY